VFHGVHTNAHGKNLLKQNFVQSYAPEKKCKKKINDYVAKIGAPQARRGCPKRTALFYLVVENAVFPFKYEA
jgi:hypothetical protein